MESTKESKKKELIYSVDVSSTLDSLEVGELAEFRTAGVNRHCTDNAVRTAQWRLEKNTKKKFSVESPDYGITMIAKRIK